MIVRAECLKLSVMPAKAGTHASLQKHGGCGLLAADGVRGRSS